MSHKIVEHALKLSQADAAIVIASESSTVNLRWANNTLTTNGATRARNVVVISVIGKSVGIRSATSTDDETIEKLVQLSEQDARSAGEADDFAPLVEGGTSANFEDVADYTSTDVFGSFAQQLGGVLQKARNDDTRLFGFAEHSLETVWLGSSNGTRLRFSQPNGSVQWNAKGNKPGASVWHGQSTLDFNDVDPTATDELLRKRLSWCDNQVELGPGRYETILPPSAVADLLIYTYWTASGRDAAEGRNVFSKPGGGTRVGEQFGPKGLRLFSDPSDSEMPTLPFVVAAASSAESSVFDNGLQLKSTDWIKDGKLNQLLNSRASAEETEQKPAPAIGNLILEGNGDRSIDEMIANTERGLLVTCLWYIREVDPQSLLLTGLTRDGIYMIENGKVTGAVNNFRFNESPVDLLGRISEVGESVQTLPREWADYFTLTRMPAIRIPDFNMSSVSPAS